MTLTASWLNSQKPKLKKYLLFNQEPTLELFAILTVYFIQGILGLAQLAINFFLKDNLGLSPSQMAALMGIAAIPWIVKPLFGFLSDGLPIAGYHRRPYLILSGLLGTFAWIALATVVHDTWTATLAILLTSVSVAMSDVIIDSIVVERARQESLIQSGSMQSLMWTVSGIGGLLTAYLSGWLLENFSSQTVFGITAFFPLIVSGVAGLIEEKPLSDLKPHRTDPGNIHQKLTLLWNTLGQKYILLPTLFICIWQATPNTESAFFYFTTNELGFSPEFLGRVRLVTSLATLLGIGIYQRYLKAVPFRKILGWSIVLSSLLGMTTLILVTHANRVIGINDHWFSLGDSVVLTVMGQIAFMPVFVMSARLCPPGIEATLFAFLLSAFGLSGMIAYELGALLTHWLGISNLNFENLWILVVIANLSTLLPLPLLGWLPNQNSQQES